MGFFSGIGNAIKGVVGAIAEPISSIANIGSSIMGVASPFMEQSSVNSANAANIAASREQMAWQEIQNQKAMDFTASLQGSQFHHNRLSADTAMSFSDRMSSTAYQRAVKDMAAAGLNPMLAYANGPASSPAGIALGGSAGSGTSSAGAMARSEPSFRAQSVASAAGATALRAQAEQAKVAVDNIKAETENKRALTANIEAETRLKSLQGDSEGYRPQLLVKQSEHSDASAQSIRAKLLDELDKLRADTDSSRATAAQTRSQNALMKELQSNPNTKGWAPYLLDVLRAR